MNVPVKEDPPNCFGKLWQADHVECKGGLDPAFVNEKTGSHVREKCWFFDSCGARTQAAKLEAHRGLVQPESLVRPQVPFIRPQQTVAPTPPPTQGYIERFAQSVQQQQVPRPTFPVQQAPVQYGYQQMMPVNYQMPGYLTVPEERGSSLLGFVGRTVTRSILKSLGHSIAHLFDTTTLGPPHGNGGTSNRG